MNIYLGHVQESRLEQVEFIMEMWRRHLVD